MPNAHVLGLGQSGLAAARLLKAQGWQVSVSDRGTGASLIERQAQLKAEGILVHLGQLPEFDQTQLAGQHLPNLVVVSPGIAWDHPSLMQARRLGINTIGEVELAWRYLQDRPWVGITGTNGKTTTTALTAAIFQAAGLNAPACGNIGLPACELALVEPRPDWIIAELSSYQIESSPSVQPRIGIWTTFTPDHLARHYTLDAYSRIKAHLMHRSGYIVLNGDDPYLAEKGPSLWPQAIWTCCTDLIPEATFAGATIRNEWITFAGEPILPISKLKLLGYHNQQNVLMAVAAAKLAKIDSAVIAEALTNFSGVPHRLEHVRTYQGLDLINDSKATNYDAAEVGLRAVVGPVVLIAGGEPKQGEPQAWLQMIKKQAIAVVLIGQAAPLFAELLDSIGYSSYEVVETLEQAVPKAVSLGQTLGAKTVLLSPACASFDQFANFEQRGDQFRQLCLDL